jgi:hypothetical protein
MSGIQIKNYIMLFKNDKSFIHKRNKKKLSKRHILKRVNFEFVKYTQEDKLLDTLSKALLSAKKHRANEYGVIFDTNIIVHDITYIPAVPDKYDILCLESELDSYKKSGDNSLYWTPTNILSSGNFIINGSSIDKVLEIIKSSKDTTQFYKNLNKLHIYTVTQVHFSETEKHYIHDPLVINKKLSEQDILQYESKLANEFYDKFVSLNLPVDKLQTIHIKHELLPKISLICPFTDKAKFFHTLLSFLKLDYPQHLLELVIIDDSKSEKQLNLPQDKRIRLINIDNKNKNNDTLPFGYKLNIGVKHSSNELILNFFDTNNYNLNLYKLVSHFILSQKQCVMSIDTGLYNKNLGNGHQAKLPDLANCLYTKDFWRKCSFEEISHNFLIKSDLVYKWIFYRHKETSFLPFVYMSFKLVEDTTVFIPTNECQFNLSTLVDKKIKESYNLLST